MQLPPEHPDGWQVRGPSNIPYGFGKRPHPVHELTVDEIKGLHRGYADAARRSTEAGYQWLELHFAHGYLAASFFSPLANQRTDAYGGNAARELGIKEAFELVPEDWGWWLQNFRGHALSIGWPEIEGEVAGRPACPTGRLWRRRADDRPRPRMPGSRWRATCTIPATAPSDG